MTKPVQTIAVAKQIAAAVGKTPDAPRVVVGTLSDGTSFSRGFASEAAMTQWISMQMIDEITRVV